LTNALLPYLQAVGDFGIVGLVNQEPGFGHGINLYQGNLAHPEIGTALGREVTAKLPMGGS
jgi:alanine dehydrogenase